MPGLPLPATATVKDTLRRQQQRQQRQRPQQRPPHRTLTGAAILAGQRPGHEEEDHPVPPVDAPPLDAPPVEEQALEEQALEVALDGIEHAADVCERAYNEYNSARAASVVAKHEWQRANREVDDRKQRRSDAQRAWAREMSNGKQNGKDPINLDEWVQERDGFTGRTEWVNVNTQERQTMKPKETSAVGGAFNDVAKEKFHEAVASEEDAVAYMTTKKVQWGAAKERAVVAEEAMVVAKERLREVSLHVLPNIAEERAEENLPLPSAVDHEGWAERRRRQGGGEGKEGEEGKRGGGLGREMSMSQEERDYEKQMGEEMKAQVVSIHQEDQSISDWAARAAKLSLKKHIVLGKDGAITSST
jgi:hypothetical protein